MSSRIPKFGRMKIEQRRKIIQESAGLDNAEMALLLEGGFSPEEADLLVEGVIGLYALPLGIATNFLVNGRDVLVPMAVEEPSVIAAASNAARMIRQGGGFDAEADESIMAVQVELKDPGPDAAQKIMNEKDRLLTLADEAQPELKSLGGGARDIEIRKTEASGNRLIVHIYVDCLDAMGANAVNTIGERLAPELADLADAVPGLKILSNLADRRLVRVKARVKFESLERRSSGCSFTGADVARRVVEASDFALADPYRAATHNKGIMNGVDAVIMATGNDWRAVEAGAHSYAAAGGTYGPLSTWSVEEDGILCGSLEMPMAIGIVGGAARIHRGAAVARKIMNIKSARELACIIGSAGLASNLAALAALGSEGIQAGHMGLHARSVAMSAGATGDQIDAVASRMCASGPVTVPRAEEILSEIRSKNESEK